ncbi:MAG: AAA family ATPase [Cryomorphaceae bacterium]
MRLLKYKVNKFRSVKGTEWIEVDQWTCFVGVNESGKTNLLLPLWKLNPADDATKIDLLLDYPRDEYSEIDANDGARKNEPFVEVLFELTDSELTDFKKCYTEYRNPPKAEEAETTADTKETEAEPSEEIEFTKHLLIKKNYAGVFYVHISNEKCEEITDDIEQDVGKDLFKAICDGIPRFVYYSEYGNLDSDLYLPRVKEDLKRIDSLSGKERMKARTLKILFGHLKLNPDEILALGRETAIPNNDPKQKADTQIEKESRNKQERYAKVTSAASRLSSQFKDWWTQGNYVFHFNADGEYFRILVSDSERPSPIELESRSKGLQWFFSFFLVFLAESEENHRDCVLLLDEPGLSLHPNAQIDLIRFFNQLSDDNQLIYTTHLPFLVDHNNLDRVKAVYTEKGLTKASNDISKADKERKAIQPVNAAIGITASQSLLVGCDIVIVEGVSDQFYLTMIKNHLIAKGKFKPKKEMVFIPVGGAKGVKPFVSIVHGSTNNLPYALLDSDETGKQFQKSLQQGLYSGEKKKVLEIDTFSGKQGSEIEDLIPASLIVDSFDRIFRPEDISVAEFDLAKPILPQLEAFASETQIPLELGWKVEIAKKVKQRFTAEIEDSLQEKWVQLFKALQS